MHAMGRIVETDRIVWTDQDQDDEILLLLMDGIGLSAKGNAVGSSVGGALGNVVGQQDAGQIVGGVAGGTFICICHK